MFATFFFHINPNNKKAKHVMKQKKELLRILPLQGQEFSFHENPVLTFFPSTMICFETKQILPCNGMRVETMIWLRGLNLIANWTKKLRASSDTNLRKLGGWRFLSWLSFFSTPASSEYFLGTVLMRLRTQVWARIAELVLFCRYKMILSFHCRK